MGYPLGQCNQCGGEPRLERRTCAPCAERQSTSARLLRETRASLGLCTTCGTPAAYERAHCAYHLRYFARSTATIARERLAAGLCIRGGCPHPRIDGHVCCVEHEARDLDRWRRA